MPLEIQIQKSAGYEQAGAITVKLAGSLDTSTAPELERQLAPVPSGYSRGYIDGYAVVYSPRTQIVIDFVAVFGR